MVCTCAKLPCLVAASQGREISTWVNGVLCSRVPIGLGASVLGVASFVGCLAQLREAVNNNNGTFKLQAMVTRPGSTVNPEVSLMHGHAGRGVCPCTRCRCCNGMLPGAVLTGSRNLDAKHITIMVGITHYASTVGCTRMQSAWS